MLQSNMTSEVIGSYIRILLAHVLLSTHYVYYVKCSILEIDDSISVSLSFPDIHQIEHNYIYHKHL